LLHYTIDPFPFQEMPNESTPFTLVIALRCLEACQGSHGQYRIIGCMGPQCASGAHEPQSLFGEVGRLAFGLTDKRPPPHLRPHRIHDYSRTILAEQAQKNLPILVIQQQLCLQKKPLLPRSSSRRHRERLVGSYLSLRESHELIRAAVECCQWSVKHK
jgi:hypothetical protein